MRSFDIVFACDPRFEGGTISAITAAMRAAVAGGLRAAVLPFRCGLWARPRLWSERFVSTLRETGLPLLSPTEPAETRIVFAEHPFVFQAFPDRPARLRTDAVVLVAHHPPMLADGREDADFGRAASILGRFFGAPVMVAPVGPAVRRSLVRAGVGDLTAFDLYNCIDPAASTCRRRNSTAPGHW